jgi:hypothetical protein
MLVSYRTLGHLFCGAQPRPRSYWPARGHQARAHVCLARIWAKARSLVIKRCHTQIGNSRNCLIRCANHYAASPGLETLGVGYRESAPILAEARILRQGLRGIFVLRTLVHRGRAAPTPETPRAFARLIGGPAPASRPRTRAAKVRSSPGLPDPLAHLVCKFWLGEPPRRRRAEPATE